jgi:hypothetical protein
MAVDYGHWDATLADCVDLVARRPGIDEDYAIRLLSRNAMRFYGERLRRRVERCPVDAGSGLLEGRMTA